MTKEQQEVEVRMAKLRRGECPFDGDHFSSLSRAACEVCNPPKAERSKYDER